MLAKILSKEVAYNIDAYNKSERSDEQFAMIKDHRKRSIKIPVT
jgi:hypothetical protein